MNSASASPLGFSKAMRNPEYLGRKECNLDLHCQSQLPWPLLTSSYFSVVVGEGCILPGCLIIQSPQSAFSLGNREWIEKGKERWSPRFKTKTLLAADACHWVPIPQNLARLSSEKLQEGSSRRSLLAYVTLFMFPSNQLVK